MEVHVYIIESVDSISRDERDAPLTQYITNAAIGGISRDRYNITYFKHHHRVLWLISNRMSVQHRYIAQFTYAPRELKKS